MIRGHVDVLSGHTELILERIVTNAEVEIVRSLPSSSRGAGGFGHTGLAYLSYDDMDSNFPSRPAVLAGEVASPPQSAPSPH